MSARSSVARSLVSYAWAPQPDLPHMSCSIAALVSRARLGELEFGFLRRLSGTASAPAVADSQPLAARADFREQQRDNLDLLHKLNDIASKERPSDSELAARTRSYELAYRMETSAPEAVDFSKEPPHQELYGLNDEDAKEYGEVLLRARRLSSAAFASSSRSAVGEGRRDADAAPGRS